MIFRAKPLLSRELEKVFCCNLLAISSHGSHSIGIGRAIAVGLLDSSIKRLIAISRTQSDLESLAKEVKQCN